jgi:hypothetical protein
MEMPVQIKLTSSLFRLAVGDETALSDILGPRRYVPMLDTSAATIAEAGLSGALLSAAAGSKSNGIRTAAANCADISDTAVLQRLVSDPSPDVRKAAAAKLLSGGSTPQMLGTLYSSAHPEIRTSVIESPHVTDDILLKALNDPDQNVALAAANKALGSSPSPAAVTTAATSRWPGVVAKAVALVALTDKASVKNLLASTDALVRSAMIGRAKSSLTTADLTDIAGSNTNPDVLWMVIEHSASTPAAAAKALNGIMKKTNKVIDVEEKTHWQSGSTDSEPGEDVVDQEEVSHYEYQPADITKAVKSLTKKTSTAPAILHAVTGDLASVLTSAYNNIVGEQIIASVRTGKTTPANIAPAAQYLSGLDAARAADIISGLDAGVAASLLSAMQVEKSAAIHAKLPDAFKLAMLRKASGR